MENQGPRIIDLRAVVKAKFPAHYPKVPGWVFSLTEWLICAKIINHHICRCYPLTGPAFAEEVLRGFGNSYTLIGEENLPKADDGKSYTFVSNHPLGALDGIMYVAVFGPRYPKFRILVNDMLMYIDGLKDSFLPVSTVGAKNRKGLEMINAAYHDPEMQLLSFPAGTCSRIKGGKIQDLPWKKSVITQAIETHRDVVPLHFEGRNSWFFYGIEWLRQKLGIKFNIGTVLLPWQFARYANGKHYTITVGKPIPWQTFTSEKTHLEWAEWLRTQSYQLYEDRKGKK